MTANLYLKCEYISWKNLAGNEGNVIMAVKCQLKCGLTSEVRLLIAAGSKHCPEPTLGTESGCRADLCWRLPVERRGGVGATKGRASMSPTWLNIDDTNIARNTCVLFVLAAIGTVPQCNAPQREREREERFRLTSNRQSRIIKVELQIYRFPE